MMKHFTYKLDDFDAFDTYLQSHDVVSAYRDAASVLVQVFTASTDVQLCSKVTAQIVGRMPRAVVVGASTVGEIADGNTLTDQTVIGFTFFASSKVDCVSLPCKPGREYALGREFFKTVMAVGDDIAGLLILATPLSIDATTFLNGLESSGINFPVFGGGAGDYAQMNQSLVFSGTESLTHGVIGVVLRGQDLHIDCQTYLGWRPLSKEMTITAVDGMVVKTVDNAPAFNIYSRYLGLPNDENFFLNVLEFPFLIKRNGEDIARVPVAVDKDGGLRFVADIGEGEHFRIGYGDPSLILSNAEDIHKTAMALSPQAIFLYTCGCRRFLMQDQTNLETLPFQDIAPAFGFYTYGEFFFHNDNLQLLNSTMVAVCLREGKIESHTDKSPTKLQVDDNLNDPYAHQHSRIISRLVHFVNAVTNELETANQSILKMSTTDQLTGLNNRRKLDEALENAMGVAQRYREPFSVILLDMDHFKRVNDTHGHLVGDRVLVHLANVLRREIREADILGRWGGEEFLLILPHAKIDKAFITAEKLRKVIEQTPFPVVKHKTCSFGIATYNEGDDLIHILERADRALYEAKEGGRNRVQAQPAS